MKKDQRYHPVGQLGDDDVLGGNGGPYQDEPRLDQYQAEAGEHGVAAPEPDHHRHHHHHHHSPLGNRVPLQRSHSTPNRLEEHPLQQRGGDSMNDNSNTLRMRRMGGLSREGSEEKIVVLEGLSSHLDGRPQRAGNGSITSPPRPSRLGYEKNSNTEVSSASEEEEDDDDDDEDDDCDSEGRECAGTGNSRGEDGSGLFSASHGSSFDLLDDEDEINLQRYHRDFGASPFATDLHDDMGWDAERVMMENSANMYHPRTESHGSHSKDPWIRMVTQHNQQSPTNGGQMSIYSIHSISDLLLYLQGVRRQARQRRAQRLLTMPSEQWWERLQFCFMTYCWDATDVGLLVIAIMLVIWFTGLLWLARISARHNDASNARQNGAEYNANAEFDGYEKEGHWTMFQWWWWGLGLVLLVRILGPFAVQNVNNRRRERRRQRFMSGNMEQQQRRMQQQQLPTMIHSRTNGAVNMTPTTASNRHEVHVHTMSPPAPQDDSLSGVEITGANPAEKAGVVLGDPMSMA